MIPLIGAILVHSIGSGCDTFYEVTRRSARTVTVRKLLDRSVKTNVRLHQRDITPCFGQFSTGEAPLTLRVAPDGRIGPLKRMQGWRVWGGRALNQFST